MPNNLTIPGPDEFIGQCPHCGQKVTLNKIWFAKLKAIVDYLNSL